MLLLARDLRTTFVARPVRRKQRNYQQKDQHCLVGLEIDRNGTDKCHVGVEDSGSRHGALELVDLHGAGLRRVGRVEKLLFVGIEGEDGAEDEEFDAATFQQLNLLDLLQRPE